MISVLLCNEAPVAQRIEHLPSKQGVVGSSPAGRTRQEIASLKGSPRFALPCLQAGSPPQAATQ